MVKPLKDILKEIETRDFQFGGMAEGPGEYGYGGDDGGDGGGGYEPDPEDYRTLVNVENLPDPIADINRDATLTEEYTTESPIDKSVRDEQKFESPIKYPQAKNLGLNFTELEQKEKERKEAVKNRDNAKNNEEFGFWDNVVTGITGIIEGIVHTATQAIPFVPTVDLEISPGGRDLFGGDISLSRVAGRTTQQEPFSTEIDIAGMVPGVGGLVASALTPTITIGEKGVGMYEAPFQTAAKAENITDMLVAYNPLITTEKIGEQLAEAPLEPVIQETTQLLNQDDDDGGGYGGGPDDFGNDRDIIPVPIPAASPAPSPVTVAEAIPDRPTYDLWQRGQEYGTAQYPYGGKPVYNVQAGGLIGLQHGSQGYLGYNKGGNIMNNNNAQKYARGGLSGFARSFAPMGAGFLGSMTPLGAFGGLLAGAGTGYALGGKKRSMLDAVKGGLMGYAGAGIAQLGQQAAGLTAEQLQGAENIMPPGKTPAMYGDARLPSAAAKDFGLDSMWDQLKHVTGGLYDIPVKGGFDAIGPSLSAATWPIASAGAAQMLTPASERPTYEVEDEVTYKALTPEERRALARSSPLSRRFTFADFQPPNVSLTAKSGGLLNAFAEGEMVEQVTEKEEQWIDPNKEITTDYLEKLTEELNTRAGIDTTVQEEPSNMVVDEAQEVLLNTIRMIEERAAEINIPDWRKDPRFVDWGNEQIKEHYPGQDIRELEETVAIKTAKGGVIDKNEELKSGSFVLPADVVSDVGDGSSSSGHRRLAQVFGVDSYARGGISGPVKGPGGGLDDLIQTSIDGVRAASLSNDEFVVPSRRVQDVGLKAGAKTRAEAQKKGSEQLYAFMKDVRLNKHNTPSQPKALRMAGLRNIV